MMGIRRAAKLGVLFGVSMSWCSWGFGGTGQGAAQTSDASEIALDPAIECWYDSAFPILGAQLTPPEEVVHSRLYFRCSLYPDYYFVDLAEENGTFRGVAPQADSQCPRVHYYVEMLTRDFTSTRTEERIADVTSASECRRRYPAAGLFPGDDPKIFLGSTINGPSMAPGFKSIGVAGFISATGATVPAAEGGISTGLVAGLAAGGAAVGVGVLASGGGNTTTTTAPAIPSPPPPTTTIPPTTSVPAVQSVKACFRLDPPDGVIEQNEALRIDGRCSEGGDALQFHYDLGDGRIKEGQAFVTAIWPTPGIYTLTLTVSRASSSLRSGNGLDEDSYSAEITVQEPPPPPEPVVADFIARPKGDTCIVSFDASPSSGPIDRYQWALDVNNDLGAGVIRLDGLSVSYDWKQACFDDSFNGSFVARLAVSGPAGASDSIEKKVVLFIPFRTSDAKTVNGRVEGAVSTAMLDSKRARGQVLLGEGQSYPVTSETPVLLRYSAKSGRNELQAVMASDTPTLWRFDFSGTRGFVVGSLRTLAGQEVSRDAYSVVLRFAGQPGERAQIEYRMEPQ